jgi:hypothetical protein
VSGRRIGGRHHLAAAARAVAVVAVWLVSSGAVPVDAQRGAPPAAPAAQAAVPQTPQSMAPIDLVGTWVSVVTEDWRWRMMTPAKGDYASVPINDAGRKAADGWDYAAEQTPDNACKPFGVGNIVRMPGRIRISWQDPTTLKLEFDAGTQTRLLHFVARQPAGAPTWQGHSQAAWEIAGQQIEVDRNGTPVAAAGGGRGRGGRGAAAASPRGGSLRVTTTNFRPGFLRKNGVPYSAAASITEYVDRIAYPNGDVVLLVRTAIEDPQYLQLPFLTSTHFKREPDDAKWKATPCAIDPPVVRPVVTR